MIFEYWIKILKTPDNMLNEDANNDLSYRERNWAYQIKNILNKIGMSNVWLQQDNLNVNVCVIKLKIVDIYKQKGIQTSIILIDFGLTVILNTNFSVKSI
jgi:hypothetical protein